MAGDSYLRRRPGGVNLLQMPTRLLLPARDQVVAESCKWATGPGERMKGLLGQPALAAGEALILSPGRQVHTFGMRVALDVIFCKRDWTVIHIVHSMKPRRVTRLLWTAAYAIELPGGAGAGVVPGDVLVVESVP